MTGKKPRLHADDVTILRHADALATALFFDGGDALAQRWGAEWVRMLTNGRVEWSNGCSAELFTGAASLRDRPTGA